MMFQASSSYAPLGRSAAAGILGSAVFGAAVFAGHGAGLMLQGAWMAPALFVGGAALALPPLYLSSALSGGKATPSEVAASAQRALGVVSTVLLGLAAPAVFFSVTLRSTLAIVLLAGVMVVVGSAGILTVAMDRWTRETTARALLASTVWCFFAFAVGGRLMVSLAKSAGLFGGEG